MCAVCMFDGLRQEELIDLKDGQIDALRAENERLRAVLLRLASELRHSDVRIAESIDAALADETKEKA